MYSQRSIFRIKLKYKQVRDFKQFLKILPPWIREIEQNGSAGFSLSKTVVKYDLDGTEAQDIHLFVQSIQEHLSSELKFLNNLKQSRLLMPMPVQVRQY